MGRWTVSQKPKLTMAPLRSSAFEGEGGLCAIQQVTQTARKNKLKKIIFLVLQCECKAMWRIKILILGIKSRLLKRSLS